ncbi:unnamed protein product [Xyrichtys novacula]|uniref:Gypsy retrotransposon integrase-like protein 1 n=1 Tax=Xyrichtys novacula TaxID=13765 RepID=A0AAV1F8K0_XYRNO|nr:unnamed protein product [Xyrichtys novacula]
MGDTEHLVFSFKLSSVLVAGQTRTETGQPGPTEPNPKVKQCAMLKQSHTRAQPFKLPKGLVGTKSTAWVGVAGSPTASLLDTGSQVTTVPQSFYQQHLSEHEIKPLYDLLEVLGANGQCVPYLGYIELNITFPKEFLGVEFEVPTLALVVPDVHAASDSLILIGTNTLDVLYEMYIESASETQQPTAQGYKAVLKVLELRHRQSKDGNLGLVKLHGKGAQLVPAGQTVVLEGCVAVSRFANEKSVVLDHPSSSSLPGGLLVKPCLVDLPTKQPRKVPVVLTNESDRNVIVPQQCIIGEISAFQRVFSKEQGESTSRPDSPQKSDITINFSDSPIPAKWKEHITEKLNSMPEVFAQNDLDFGRTNKVKHQIKLSDETPFKHRARPIHPHDLEAVRKHLQELLQAGVIKESDSSFSSPIVVVRKKNGDVCLCIDYRKLNLQTVKDAYALPNLEEAFSTLTGSKWFSVLDLKSGYYQIEVEEADKPKTAFVCPMGFWEFNRMPQGVTNAPSTFQRLMERCMGDMNLKEVLVFLDDIIVFSKTLEEHEVRLMKVLTRLREFGLKLSPDKCKFFQTSVKYLGHIVSQDGVGTDPGKVEALKQWPRPQDLKQLRSFLGFSGYYRRFIKDYSTIVRPLTDLTSGYPPLHKNIKHKAQTYQYHDPKKPFGARWTDRCELTFNTIIEKLTTAPVLGFADPRVPYVLHTDASTTGLGAALYQEQDGHMRVIAYASRGLSRSESRYPAHKLEFLALKWAVVEKFCDYLYGNQFTVVTDSNPLTYVLTSAKLDATSYRWLAALSTFTFTLQYRPGKLNSDADGLSRRPHGEPSNDLKSQKEQERINQFTRTHLADLEGSVSHNVVRAICERHLVCGTPNDCEDSDGGMALVQSLATSPEVLPDSFVDEHGSLSGLPHLSEVEMRDLQRADSCLREVIAQIESGEKLPPTVRRELPDVPFLLREWNRLEIKNEVLYRRRQDSGKVTYQLVLPEKLRAVVLKSLHDEMGHLGTERTLNLVRTRFFWPKMVADVERKIKTCERCIRRKAQPEKAAPLVNIESTRPLELVCMDFLTVEPDRSNAKDILVITDHFTKYSVDIPTPNQKAQTVARCLWDNFMVHYGIPERLHSDQGPDFESRTIKELCKITGIRKIRTTPYHPRGNAVERFNRTLLSMLGTLDNKDKSQWRNFVKPLVHAYNCTKNDVTGFTPYELMFGRQPRLPVYLAFGLPLRDGEYKSHSQYVQRLKSHLDESYKIATQNAAKTAARNKARFDSHVTASKLEAGDRVLVRAVRLRGKHKLADKWETDVYVVVKQAGNLPVYTLRPENKDGPLRTLHRDLMLPCGSLPLSVEKLDLPRPRRPQTRKSIEQPDDVNDQCDSEDDIPYEWFREQPETEIARFTTVHEVPRPNFTAPSSKKDGRNISEQRLPVDTPVGEEHLPDIPCGDSRSNEAGNFPEVLPTAPESRTESENEVQFKGPSSEYLPAHVTESTRDVPAEKDVPVRRTEREINNDSEVSSDAVRRSTRSREKPDRFQYSRLGSPLVSIVQSLFQGLNTALTDELLAAEQTKLNSSFNMLPDCSSHAQGCA